MTLTVPCLFGLESVLAGEIRRMGGEEVAALDGRVDFSGGPELLARDVSVSGTIEKSEARSDPAANTERNIQKNPDESEQN